MTFSMPLPHGLATRRLLKSSGAVLLSKLRLQISRYNNLVKVGGTT